MRIGQDLAIADVDPVAPDPVALAKAVASVSAFTGDLYRRVAAGVSGNLVISPVSVAAALGMTLQGAHGETAEQLRHVLHADSDAGLSGGARGACGRRWRPVRERR